MDFGDSPKDLVVFILLIPQIISLGFVPPDSPTFALALSTCVIGLTSGLLGLSYSISGRQKRLLWFMIFLSIYACLTFATYWTVIFDDSISRDSIVFITISVIFGISVVFHQFSLVYTISRLYEYTSRSRISKLYRIACVPMAIVQMLNLISAAYAHADNNPGASIYQYMLLLDSILAHMLPMLLVGYSLRYIRDDVIFADRRFSFTCIVPFFFIIPIIKAALLVIAFVPMPLLWADESPVDDVDILDISRRVMLVESITFFFFYSIFVLTMSDNSSSSDMIKDYAIVTEHTEMLDGLGPSAPGDHPSPVMDITVVESPSGSMLVLPQIHVTVFSIPTAIFVIICATNSDYGDKRDGSGDRNDVCVELDLCLLGILCIGAFVHYLTMIVNIAESLAHATAIKVCFYISVVTTVGISAFFLSIPIILQGAGGSCLDSLLGKDTFNYILAVSCFYWFGLAATCFAIELQVCDNFMTGRIWALVGYGQVKERYIQNDVARSAVKEASALPYVMTLSQCLLMPFDSAGWLLCAVDDHGKGGRLGHGSDVSDGCELNSWMMGCMVGQAAVCWICFGMILLYRIRSPVVVCNLRGNDGGYYFLMDLTNHLCMAATLVMTIGGIVTDVDVFGWGIEFMVSYSLKLALLVVFVVVEIGTFKERRANLSDAVIAYIEAVNAPPLPRNAFRDMHGFDDPALAGELGLDPDMLDNDPALNDGEFVGDPSIEALIASVPQSSREISIMAAKVRKKARWLGTQAVVGGKSWARKFSKSQNKVVWTNIESSTIRALPAHLLPAPSKPTAVIRTATVSTAVVHNPRIHSSSSAATVSPIFHGLQIHDDSDILSPAVSMAAGVPPQRLSAARPPVNMATSVQRMEEIRSLRRLHQHHPLYEAQLSTPVSPPLPLSSSQLADGRRSLPSSLSSRLARPELPPQLLSEITHNARRVENFDGPRVPIRYDDDYDDDDDSSSLDPVENLQRALQRIPEARPADSKEADTSMTNEAKVTDIDASTSNSKEHELIQNDISPSVLSSSLSSSSASSENFSTIPPVPPPLPVPPRVRIMAEFKTQEMHDNDNDDATNHDDDDEYEYIPSYHEAAAEELDDARPPATTMSSTTESPRLVRSNSLESWNSWKSKDERGKIRIQTTPLFRYISPKSQTLNWLGSSWLPSVKASFQSCGCRSLCDIKMEELASVSRLPFHEKCLWIRHQIDRLRIPWERGHQELYVDRGHIVDDSVKLLNSMSVSELRQIFRFSFAGEKGLDAGGILREWIWCVSQNLFASQNNQASGSSNRLFSIAETQNICYQINQKLRVSDAREIERKFKFAGRFIGKVIFEGSTIPVHFVKTLYKHIVGAPIMFEDIRMLDDKLYDSLVSIMSVDDASDLCVPFVLSVVDEEEEKVEEIELKPGGSNIFLCNENRMEYLELNFEQRVVTSEEKQLSYFLAGIYDVIPEGLFSVFEPLEIETLIGGLDVIDVDDWKSHVNYEGFNNSHKTVVWFWEVVSGFSNEQRCKLLQFITGSCRVPVGGFKYLQGSDGGIRIFTLRLIPLHDMAYPASHTCFNRLELPPYIHKDHVADALEKVIQMDVVGFSGD